MIRQAMILAAGKGTRMRPLTLTTPKPLVPVADKPLIVWHIERLAQAGIKHITLNAGYLSDVLIAGLDELDLPNRLGITLNVSVEIGEPLETAGGIKYALSQQLLADEPFILVNGDVWTEFDFAHLTKYRPDGLAHLLMIDNPSHNPSGDFVLSDGRLSAKTDDAHALTFAGISVMSPALVAGVPAGQVAALAPLLKEAMAQGLVSGEKITDKWVDVGTMERLAEVDAYARKKLSM